MNNYTTGSQKTPRTKRNLYQLWYQMLRFPMPVEIYIQGFFLKKGFFFNGLLNNNGPKKLKVSKINQAIDIKTAAQKEAVSSL